MGTEPAWSVHPPFRQCLLCHGRQAERSFSDEVALTADVPRLCYGCHENETARKPWAHAPVIAGDCLWCHEHHRSNYEGLLIQPLPDLCYQCHDSRAIAEIDYHDLPTYGQCTDCHAAHASDTKYLLVVASGGGSMPFDHEDYREVLTRAHEDAERGADFLTMMRTVQGHLEQRDLGRARAYLMGIRGSGKVSGFETQGWEKMVRDLEAEEASAAEQQGLSGQDHTLRVAQRYYESVEQYHRGELEDARRGFAEVRESGLIPAAMLKTIEQYIRRIDEALTTPVDREAKGGR